MYMWMNTGKERDRKKRVCGWGEVNSQECMVLAECLWKREEGIDT